MAIGVLRGEPLAYVWLLAISYPCEGCGQPVVGDACIPLRYLTGDDPYALSAEETAHIWHQRCAQRAGADLDSLDDDD
jgi:hypothetical protein